ncbi:MAG TPA: hypothetical protein VHF01_18280 [Candidatus Acidoferrum sp.]|nr:hypothetical protein [Candidatus Acidoferrum sp.]
MTLNLRNTEVTTLNNQPNDPLIGIAQCDLRGSIYFRTYQYPEPLSAPVIRIAPDKTRFVTAELGKRSEFNGSLYQILDFRVDPKGQVWTLVMSRKDDKVTISIVVFDEDGKFKSQTKLQGELFSATEFVPFASGQILVTGYKRLAPEKSAPPEEVKRPAVEPFTAIFDTSGKIVRELNLPGDVKDPDTPAKNSPQSENSQKSRVDVRSAVMNAGTSLGDDGNVYLVRKTNQPNVYVISESGELLRHFQVDRPSDTANPLFMRFVGGHRLLFNFVESVPPDDPGGDTEIFAVIDAESGETLYRYRVAGTSGGAFACYNSDQSFVFLNSTSAGFMTIVKAVAQ